MDIIADQERRSRAILDVIRERIRQQREEGWTAEHDDRHTGGELARAAAAYAFMGAATEAQRAVFGAPEGYRHSAVLSDLWPCRWEGTWWKPKNPRRDLVRAAALIIAEIERLDRADNSPIAGGENE